MKKLRRILTASKAKEGAYMYETTKLYYEDVYKKEFKAKVLECREGKKEPGIRS